MHPSQISYKRFYTLVVLWCNCLSYLYLKDLRHAFDPSQRKFVESQLQRYVRVVGTELSERMVYSFGGWYFVHGIYIVLWILCPVRFAPLREFPNHSIVAVVALHRALSFSSSHIFIKNWKEFNVVITQLDQNFHITSSFTDSSWNSGFGMVFLYFNRPLYCAWISVVV